MSLARLGAELCPSCARQGKVVPVRHGHILCGFHEHVDPHARATAGAPPERPQRRWRAHRMRVNPVVKVPRQPDTASRKLSTRMLAEHASLLSIWATGAAQNPRAVGWLALCHYVIDAQAVPGARRSHARRNFLQTAAILAASSTWDSGREARPGMYPAAARIGVCQATVRRHAQLLCALGLAERVRVGKLLNAAERAEALADEYTSELGRHRWADRAEWRLLIAPDWFGDVDQSSFQHYVDQARTALRELAAPARHAPAPASRPDPPPSSPAVDSPVEKPARKVPGQRPENQTVELPRYSEVVGRVPVRRGSVSSGRAVDNTRPPSSRGQRERPKGGATRHSPKDGGSKGRRGSRDPRMMLLAARLAADGRLPFLGGAYLPAVAAVLSTAVSARWTVDDVVLEVRLRLRECGKPLVDRADSPPGYLRWLLAHAVKDEPPAQIAAAARRGVDVEQLQATTDERAAVAARYDAEARAGWTGLDAHSAAAAAARAQARQVAAAAAASAAAARETRRGYHHDPG